jgi:hypothetical protein
MAHGMPRLIPIEKCLGLICPKEIGFFDGLPIHALVRITIDQRAGLNV